MGTDRESLTRQDNWPSAMYGAIEAKRTQPFIWGQYDCCLFVCDIIFAFTGTDMAHDFRGDYDSKDSAYQLMKKKTKHKTMGPFMDSMAERYGMKEIPVNMAGRGDVALFDSDLGETLGLFDGHQLLAMGYDGVIIFSRDLARRAWRI